MIRLSFCVGTKKGQNKSISQRDGRTPLMMYNGSMSQKLREGMAGAMDGSV